MCGPALYWGLLSGSSGPNARMNLMRGAYFCRAFATAESNSSRSGISPDSINRCASLRRSATESFFGITIPPRLFENQIILLHSCRQCPCIPMFDD
jgi:hypothetical protein